LDGFMIRDAQVAKQVSDLMIECSSRLDVRGLPARGTSLAEQPSRIAFDAVPP
jgi:hypothetical protein